MRSMQLDAISPVQLDLLAESRGGKEDDVLRAPSRKPTAPKMLEVFTIQPLWPLGPRSCLRNCAQAYLHPRYTLRRFTVLNTITLVTREEDVIDR